MILYEYINSFFGDIILARRNNKIVFLEFVNDGIENTLGNLKRMFPNSNIEQSVPNTLVLEDFFCSKKITFDDLDLEGTHFQKKVWQTLFSCVPFSEVVTYSQLAELCGFPNAIRAVATAVASNPISLIIPCHRVVNKSGKGFGNYRWGADVKEKIINWEQFNSSFKGKLVNENKICYKKFTQGLIPTNKNVMLGVPIPVLRRLAKDILKQNPIEFIDLYLSNLHLPMYYEEIMVLGIVIANLKVSNNIKLDYYHNFIPLIDNWAVCDVFCGESKWIKKNPTLGRSLIDYYIKCNNTFNKRFAIILMLSQFINQENIDHLFITLSELDYSNDYYVDMAVAWLLATTAAKHPMETFSFIQNNAIPLPVLKKTAQKMRDSFRVSKEEKDRITKYVNSFK